MAHELKDALAGGGDAIQVVERRPDVRVLETQGKSVAMLLYLNKESRTHGPLNLACWSKTCAPPTASRTASAPA